MRGNEIGKYYIQIVPTTDDISGQIQSELSKGDAGAEKAGSTVGSKFASGFGTAVKAIGAAVTTATAAAVAATSKLVKETAAYGDKIDKASQKIGISAEAYQEWDFIAQHSGTSMDALTMSFKALQVAAQNGSDAFQRLNISADEAASMSTEELFAKTIAGLQEMGEGSERTAIAAQLLGRGSIELGALLNTSAEDTEAMKNQVHDLGGVMSNTAVKDAARFQDSLQNMQTALAGVGRSFAQQFLPSISTAMDGLAKIFAGDPLGTELLKEGVDEFTQGMIDAFPRVLEAVTPAMESIFQAISDSLPQILVLGEQVLNMIIGQLPNTINTIVQMLPQILTSVANALLNKNNLQILIEGVINLTVELVKKVPEILVMLWNAIGDAISGAFRRFGDLFSRLWEDILKPALKALLNGLIMVLNKAIDHINVIIAPLRAIVYGVGALFGVNWSFDDVAIPHIPMLAEGGILSSGKAIVGEKGPELLEVYGGKAKVTPLSTSETNVGGITINIYSSDGMDPRSIADAVSEQLAREFFEQRAAFA